MTKKQSLLGVILALLTGALLLAEVILRTFLPRIILPELNGKMMILLSLAALVIDSYISGGGKRSVVFPLYGALIFGLFPWAAAFLSPVEALKTAVLGAVILTVAAVLFDSIAERLSTGPASKAAPVVSAFMLYLASQCFMGIF